MECSVQDILETVQNQSNLHICVPYIFNKYIFSDIKCSFDPDLSLLWNIPISELSGYISPPGVLYLMFCC